MVNTKLNWIATKYPRTDKPTAGDGRYLDRYEYHFAPVRDKVRRVLEIGVREGDSLRMWRDYFPNALVYGVDIDKSCHFGEDRIMVAVGDAGDPDMATVLHAFGAYDIIIDDGSHKAADIIAAMKGLLPALAPGGFYCVEDLGTQAMPQYRDYRDADHNALEFLYKGVVCLNDGSHRPQLSAFHFYPHLAVMRKS